MTIELLVERAVGLSQVTVRGGTVLWNESRPEEAGRQVVVALAADGEARDAFGQGYSARTLVHEYGGRCYDVHDDVLYFSNFADQRLHRVALDGSQPPEPLTPEPHAPLAVRFADHHVSPDARWLLCVREQHLDGAVVNDLVAVPTGGGTPQVLAAGRDFYAAPRLSPDGTRLAWLCWDLPNMPWDGTELWEAPFLADGRLGEPRLVAGAADESVSQPRWSPGGALHFVTDRTGWWNLYADDGGHGQPLAPMAAEFSGPDWVFGQATYAFLADGTLVAAWKEPGSGRLGVVADGGVRPLEAPFTWFDSVQALDDAVVCLAASPTSAPAVVVLATGGRDDVRVVRRSRDLPFGLEHVSAPEHIEFPTTGGRVAHAHYYAPRNADFSAGPDERPPLVVLSHGGPTSAALPVLNVAVQFWTTRGIAVVDVDYGGSSGYGREYRRRLDNAWGVVDVDDCVHAARYLAERGLVDGDRLAIRGGSAGGYTTLCALTFTDVFATGASHYGVADLESLARETHKFESRYLDRLVGPYPATADLYRRRSPIHAADRLSSPIILFQGLDDRVVPPDQAELMAEAMRANGVPFALLTFDGEQHGFRRAETITRVAGAELWFYGRVLGFAPADDIEPVPIENEHALVPRR